MSNLLGVEFEEYLENNEGDIIDVLDKFLKENGFVDNPLEVAPNSDEIPEDYTEKTPPATNKTYTPMYTVKEEVSEEKKEDSKQEEK